MDEKNLKPQGSLYLVCRYDLYHFNCDQEFSKKTSSTKLEHKLNFENVIISSCFYSNFICLEQKFCTM